MQVYYTPENRYINSLIREAFARLGVSHVEAVPTEQQLVTIARELANATPPARAVALKFWGFVENGTDERPAHLHASLFAGPLPFDIQLHYPEWLIAQPEGPVKEEQFPEVNTLLPIMAALQQRDLELQALRFAYPYPLPPVKLQRFPYPEHIEHKDTKNYALVLTRFCIGMLIPFSVFVARLAEEKSTGMKELMRLSGLNDWLYWGSHYLTAFVIHVAISTIMMLFVSVKRNEEGRPFILYSDPTLVFWILMCFCSSSIMHAMLLSMFFASPQSAVAGAMLYWTIFCSMPFLALEHDYGHGYHYIKRRDKLLTSVFPGMSLHWSFRVLERFEKFGFAGCSSGQILIGNYDIKTCTRDALKGIPRSKVRLEVVNLLNDVGLMAYKTAFPYEMTLGTQRRLSAALAILGSPKILVMDEPTSNMDADGRREMWQLLLQVRRNATVLLTTAILEEADVLGDRIVVMANGTIRYIGSPTFLKELFNTGYCLHINKYPKCKVAAIRKLLQKYAPKTKLRHNTNSEAVFMLGQAVSSRSLIAMFMDLEQSVDELRVESIGLSMKSLEDVLIKVGDQRHIRTRRATKPTLPKGSSDGDEDHLGANREISCFRVSGS
ncbi:hypothetical protein HPB48_022526 [Haemaphysalis longicornis]|uniref:ABC transporter domain-containing protein n=1 Tax=Haemaphysalis longicornis TaxID=44386 RepID=A0A9J6G777_HAELO|nr:hypothetical protein HPB48_022526 [Haemaphysalis longicornis]